MLCLKNLKCIQEEGDGINEYVNMTYGGLNKSKKDILYDFFIRSAFDGYRLTTVFVLEVVLID
jgi:hypothetical protein